MELRGHSHFHFIQALRSGLVTKILNVGYHGRPALKFKKVQDIYEIRHGSLIDCGRVKIESECLPMVERNTLAGDQKTCISNDDDVVGDSDDLNPTLKQLKERCKKKKRKLSIFLNSSCTKQEQLEDDELDLETPLISWKSKGPKNSGTKKKCIKRDICRTSQSAVSIVEADIISDNKDCQSCDELPTATIDIKAVVTGDDHPDTSSTICFADDRSVRCNELGGSSRFVLNEMLEDCQSCDELSTATIDIKAVVPGPDDPDTSSTICSADEILEDCDELPTATIDIKTLIPEPDDPDTSNTICSADDCSVRCNKLEGSSGLVLNEMLEDCDELPTTTIDIKAVVPGPDDPDTSNTICSAGDHSVLCNELEGSSGSVLNEMLEDCDELPTATIDIKAVVPGPDDPDTSITICSDDDHSICCNELEDPSGLVLNETFEDWQSSHESSTATNDIKAVVPGLNEPDTSNTIFSTDDCSIHCNDLGGVSGLVLNDMFKATNEFVPEFKDSISSREELQTCITKEGLYECGDQNVLNSCSNFRTEGGNSAKVVNSEMISSHSLPFPVIENKENCTVNEISYEYSGQDEHDSGMTEHQSPPLPALKIKEGGCFSHPLTIEIFQETSSSIKDYSYDIHVSSQICSVTSEINKNDGIQVVDMTSDSRLESNEFTCPGEQCADGNTKYDALPHDLESDTTSCVVSNCCSQRNSHPCLSLSNCLASSVEDDSPRNEGKQSLMSVSDVAPINCSTGTQDFDGNHEFTTSPVISNYCHSTLQHPPQRLRSTKMAISPSSQERLCQAMRSAEFDVDGKHYKSKGKLHFMKTTGDRAQLAGSIFEATEVDNSPNEQINRSLLTANFNQFVQKPNIDKRGSHPKGILKAHHSHALPPLRTGCTSIQDCSQSAIAFSQRQVHDIGSLAAMLTKQLNSMKDILENKRHPEASLSEVRVAIENAAKAEESARRWISIMTRDCARFCKIMKRAEKDAAASENVVPKEKRKIKFADEVGRMLCEVKTFNGDMASPPP